ncbi:TPA: hypothetical protein ACRR2I_004335 [Providencia rettgeri]
MKYNKYLSLLLLFTGFGLCTAHSSLADEIFFNKLTLAGSNTWDLRLNGNYNITSLKNLNSTFPVLPGHSAQHVTRCVGFIYTKGYINGADYTSPFGLKEGWQVADAIFLKSEMQCNQLAYSNPDAFVQELIGSGSKNTTVDLKDYNGSINSIKQCIQVGFGSATGNGAISSYPPSNTRIVAYGCSDNQKIDVTPCSMKTASIQYGTVTLSDVKTGISASSTGTVTCPADASVSMSILYKGSIAEQYDVLTSNSETLRHKTILEFQGKSGSSISSTSLSAGSYPIKFIDSISGQNAKQGDYTGSVVILMNSN